MNRSENRLHRGTSRRWLALALSMMLLLSGLTALAEGLTIEETPAEAPAEQVAEEQVSQEAGGGPSPITISWKVDDTVIATTQVEPGQIPSYEGEPPAKADGENVRYSFTGWTPELHAAGSEDESYSAVFAEIPLYAISWIDGNGNTIKTDKVVKDATPAYSGDAPVKDADAQFEYTFNNTWTPDIVAATENASYTAQFDSTTRAYSIKFVDGDGVTLQEGAVNYGETPAYSGESTPTKTEDAQYTYAFNNTWQPAIAAVTGEQTYTALFDGTLKKYTITWKGEDGATLGTTEVEYGAVPTYADQTKASTAEFDYTFAWNPTPVAVNGPATYTAQFTSVKRNYTVTFKDEAGNALSTKSYPYGTQAADVLKEAPAAPAKADNLFVKWVLASDSEGKTEVTTVTGAAEYKPFYESLIKKTADGYTYKLNEAKTEATIQLYEGSEKALTVPAKIGAENAKVVAIGANAFKGKKDITSVDIPDGVKSIGDAAFAGCEGLVSLTVPDTLESVGQGVLDEGKTISLVLRCTQKTKLNPADTITPVVAEGEAAKPAVKLPQSVTDILVTQNGDVNNPAELTLDCNFYVSEGHTLTVESGATLTNNATVTNFGKIANSGTFTNAVTVLSCAGEVEGEITGGNYRENGQHNYVDGKCDVCGQEAPEDLTLNFRYIGSSIKKTYDKTHNVKLSKDDFEIEDKHDLDLTISGISASYDEENAGKRTVNVTLTITGEGVSAFSDVKTDKKGVQYLSRTTKVSATIEPKVLTITPTAGQKKTYGAADPSTYKGTVRGLLSGDKITGKLSRETGDNVGKYRILQGTIDAGDNYDVQVVEQYFVIEAKSINASDVGLVTIGNQRYTGQKVEPAITLRFGKKELKQDTDFKAVYTNNIQPGVASVKLTGMGNYTGERETSFRILNIASGVSTGSGSGGGGSSGGGGGYSYSGFDDGEYESMEDYDDEEEEEEEDENLGKLILGEDDYGTILFDADGMPAPFVQFEETIENLTGDENAPEEYRLTIIADPLTDEETGETLLLDDGEREQYDELHLRLTVPLVDTLTSLGYTEIVYEVDSAELVIPLSSLAAEIPLEDQVEAEVIGTIQPEEETVEGGEAVARAIDELEVELAPTSLIVDAYDIVVEQSEVALLTEREIGLLETYDALTPTYRVLVRAVVESEEGPQENLPASEDGETVELPLAERLPERGYPVDLKLRVAPLEDAEGTPENALAVYISIIEDAADADLVEENPALFTEVEGMTYAELAPKGDGLYTVAVHAGEEVVYAEPTETDGEDAEFEDFGGSSSGGALTGPSLSGFGTSFTFDENGNPVVDN